MRRLLLVGLALLVWGCTPATSPSGSVPSSAVPSEAVSGNLPPGCEPIVLVSPDGEPVQLEGTWVHTEGGQEMTWWIRTDADCVWGAGLIPSILIPDLATAPHLVQSLNGHLGSDFAISGEILNLAPPPPGAPRRISPYAPLRMLVEFDDDGAVVLREDRVHGEIGPRCPAQDYCPVPLVLERAD